MADDIRISSSVNPGTYTARIEMSLVDWAARSESAAKEYLSELLARVLRTAVMEQYSNLQKLVDEVIFKPETRALVEQMIRDGIQKEIQSHIDGMFGNDNG